MEDGFQGTIPTCMINYICICESPDITFTMKPNIMQFPFPLHSAPHNSITSTPVQYESMLVH